MISKEQLLIVQHLNEANHILIGAGAGLSAAAGIDYTDTLIFAQLFPGLVKRGFRRFYDMIGYSEWSQAEQWGYFAPQINFVRYQSKAHPVYLRLLELVKDKDYFVMTTNTDGMFIKNGFDAARLYTPQGNYDLMQCLTPCTPETWPTKPIIDRILPSVDPETHTVIDPTVIPKCPNCGGAVFMNVRGGNWFVEKPYQEQLKRLNRWLQSTLNHQLLLIDIGTGFNTPSVVRWPIERITYQHPHAHLIRINLHYPQVAKEIESKSTSLAEDALTAITSIWQATKS